MRVRNAIQSILFFYLMFIVAILFSCNEQTTVSVDQDIKLISEISAARAKAFNDRNAAGIAVHFADSCVLMAPGKPASFGTQAVQAYYQSIFDEFHTELESHYEDVEVSGSLAYGGGVDSFASFLMHRHEPLLFDSRYLVLLYSNSLIVSSTK